MVSDAVRLSDVPDSFTFSTSPPRDPASCWTVWLVAQGSFVRMSIFAVRMRLRSAFTTTAGWSFFTTKVWFPDANPPMFGVLALAFGTVISSLAAVVIAALVAIGAALFITEVAPARVGRPLGYVIDLLAAVPSVVFGLWGLVYVVPKLIPVGKWLNSVFGWIPLIALAGIFVAARARRPAISPPTA